MDELTQLRLAALDKAMNWSLATGINCRECMLDAAEDFADFLETGIAPGHEDDEDQFAFDFETDGPLN
ncbi:MAG: hypothetical protein P4M09_17345 [Devosia sp.]|nr:hypothetical protein [Devosia sp.]